MASADLNELFAAARDFAKTMLAQAGEFIPFGVSMSRNGDVAMVAGDTGSEHPASEDMISLLQRTFVQLAADGSIRAAGVCIDVRVAKAGEPLKTDAICVRLAHVSGEAVEVYIPYARAEPIGCSFGQVFASKSNHFRLVEA